MQSFKKVVGNLGRWLSSLSSSAPLRVVQRCFTYLIPILVVGSFALLLYTLPIPAYLEFIATFADGFFLKLFTIVNKVTLDSMSLFIMASLPIAYCSVTAAPHTAYFVFVSLGAYLAYVGDIKAVASLEAFTPKWTFIALIVSSLVCLIVNRAIEYNSKRTSRNRGTAFYISPFYLLVAAGVIIIFAAIGRLMNGFLNLNFLSKAFESLFDGMGRTYGSAMLFQLLIHLMWMLGIHGSNVLDGVATGVFEQGVAVNQALIAAGDVPTEIFTKSFFDVFVLMGGCGVSLCIVVALLIAAKRRGNRMVARSALFPCLFNISELVVYGLPVVLNPILLLPFLITPLVLLSVSTLATTLGLLPVVCRSVTWTTPILLSGYNATGSIVGSLVQLINLVLGVLIYLPFIRLSEKIADERYKQDIANITSELLQNEANGREFHPLGTKNLYAASMQNLLLEFYEDLEQGKIGLYYQPQVNSNGATIGAEALLRWNNRELGFVAPPLVIAMTKDDLFGEKLGFCIIEWAAAALEQMHKRGIHHFKLSVNIAAFQLADQEFCSTVEKILERHPFGDCQLAFEITEREAMFITSYISDAISKLKSMGIPLMLDDFGMGHNSITYISREQFEFVKLDGALVKDLLQNPRSQDIVRSICALGQELGCKIVAEYVESETLRNMLETLGCHIYQGYYYGKAMPMESFMSYYNGHGKMGEPAEKLLTHS